jgi:hypothetical protein
MSKQYILMADIIESRKKKPTLLMKEFKKISSYINNQYPEAFFSPITITLGDEFQSIVRSIKKGTDIIVAFEEKLIQEKKEFKLRYVLHLGKIETPISREAAYGMLGPGLVEARSRLAEMKHSSQRFYFSLGDPTLTEKMNILFYLYQFIVDEWKADDYKLVTEFFKHDHYKIVAQKLKKDVSLMWRRKKSLKINEYKALKKLIVLLSNDK